MKITNEQISFVVQGPVQASVERQQNVGITQQCLQSIRHFFPDSPIILSTWKGQNLDGLTADTILELDDPGPNCIFEDGKLKKLNNNRQLYSSHMGLKQVTTEYAVKIRTDNKLISRNFVTLYEKYADIPRQAGFDYLSSRVVTNSAFFVSSHSGKTVHFSKSDLFDFGKTQDLLVIWGDDMLSDLHFSKAKGHKSRYPSTEQFLCLHWLEKLLGKKLYIHSKANDNAGLGDEFWPNFIANNLIIDAPENIGLDVTERFYKRGKWALEYDLKDWLYLNGQIPQPVDLKRSIRFVKQGFHRLFN